MDAARERRARLVFAEEEAQVVGEASASFAVGSDRPAPAAVLREEAPDEVGRAPPLSPCTRHSCRAADAPARCAPTPSCRCCTARSQSARRCRHSRQYEKGRSTAGPPLAQVVHTLSSRSCGRQCSAARRSCAFGSGVALRPGEQARTRAPTTISNLFQLPALPNRQR